MDELGNSGGGGSLTEKLRAANRKIFFVNAVWSAGSAWVLARFKERVQEHGTMSDDVCYLDTDEYEDELRSLPELYGVCHGWGGVIVVRDGQVAFTINLGDARDQFDSRWNQIMSAYNTTEKS